MSSSNYPAELNVPWELLRSFVAAATARTFGEAAVQQRVTVSAISQQMKALERALGLALFERVGRNVRVTADGRRLLARIEPAAQGITEAVRELRDQHGAVAGQVAIGSPRAFGAVWLRPRLARLLARHPELTVAVEFGVPSVLERRLADGALDLCLLVRPAELPQVTGTVIATETFVAVASPGYVAAHGPFGSRDSFARARYLVFDDDLAMHAPWWRASFGRAAPPPRRIAAKVASLDELRALAEAGIGIAVLPDYFVAGAPRLVRLEPRNARPAQNAIFLAHRTHAVASARFAAVKAALSR